MTKIVCADARTRALPGALLFLIILALVALALAPRLAGAVPGQLPAKPNWSPVTILYNSDVGGKIEPCG